MVNSQGTKQREQSLGDCWQWNANGQCSKGNNCSSRHDVNKFAKSTQPNPSSRFSTQQNLINASRTRSPRGRSPSRRMARWPCKDDSEGTRTNPFFEKVASFRVLVLQVREWMQIWEKCSMRIDVLMNSLAKGLKRMITKVQ